MSANGQPREDSARRQDVVREDPAAELQRRIDMLESILDSMGDGVVVVDERGQFLLFNAAARRIYGHGPIAGGSARWAETYGAFLTDGITPFPGDALPLSRALRGESTNEIELFFRNSAHPDGIWVSSTGRPLLDTAGRARGGIVVLRDISRRRRAETDLREINERLVLLSAEKGRHAQQSRTLAEMSSLLQAAATFDEIHSVVGSYLERLLPGSKGAFFVYSASRDDLERCSHWGGLPDLEPGVMKPDECWGLRRGRAHYVDGGAARLPCRHVRPGPDESYVCVPVLGPDEMIGLLHVRFDEGWAIVPDESERTLISAAEYISLALVNLRLQTALRQQSIRDPLTGLFNRRFLEETLTQEVRRATRRQTSVAVLMLDLDHFKQFNDTYGHLAGDHLLREFGRLLNDGGRGGDIAARYGGEEFALVLPDAAVGDARRRAEQLHQDVKLLGGAAGHGGGTVTVSIGIATCPHNGEQPDALLRAADAALYVAKQSGRNGISVSESSPLARYTSTASSGV